MLEIANLNTYYDRNHTLKDICLEVRQEEIVTLIGSNGAGKTTLLKSIMGIQQAGTGEVIFNDENITNLPVHRLVQKGISLCPEGRQVFPRMTVLENLEMGAYTRKLQWEIDSAYKRVYSLFPILKERSNQLAGTLSGGEQQMLAIARALMSNPSLLLMDEPSLGLAPIIVDRIFELINEIRNQGVTILLVEQNASLALDIADRGYVIETGRVVLEGTGQELLSSDRVRKAYLGEVV